MVNIGWQFFFDYLHLPSFINIKFLFYKFQFITMDDQGQFILRFIFDDDDHDTNGTDIIYN